jgi:YgiT-type zinc finger domain-containing protein
LDWLQSKEEMNTMAFEQCPVCGGNLVEKEVEKILRGGANTAAVKVCAQVCLRCGETVLAGDCEEIRADQGQAGTPGNQGISGDRSLIPCGVVQRTIVNLI